MRVGLVVAMEMDSIFEFYKDCERLESSTEFEVYRVLRGCNEIFVVHSGVGEIAAACGTQYIITKYQVEMIVNFGVVGGLSDTYKKEKMCIVKDVVHYRFDSTKFLPLELGQVPGHDSIFIHTSKELLDKALQINPNLATAVCCSGDLFVETETEKRELHEKFSGDICDMESAGIVLTCEQNKIPCVLYKGVSDGLSDGSKGFYEELKDVGTLALKYADELMNMIGE